MFFHPKLHRRILYSIPVFLTLCMIVGLYYCYVVGFMMIYSPEVVVVPSIIFHVTLIFLLWSYYATTTTDPGGIPTDFEQTAQASREYDNYDEQDYKAAKISLCKKCNLRRPPRTHHCSLCERCVLRMDHHCPWMSNCIGFQNHRFFIQFLAYAGVTCLNLGISCVMVLSDVGAFVIESLVGTVGGFVVTLTVFSLLGFHLYLIATNQTTLEVQGENTNNVFDTKSLRANFVQVFGCRGIGYLLPVKTGYGVNGIVYPLRIRSGNGDIEVVSNELLA